MIAGTIGNARELVGDCLREIDRSPEIENSADAPTRIRNGIGQYKRRFAETHCQSHLGISYAEFRKSGRTAFPEDLYREVAWEIKNHYSQTELIIAGFVHASPIIIKVADGLGV